MPPKATAQDPGRKIRLPQQHVRAGRGTAGYMGKNIEVYDTAVPRSYAGNAGVIKMSERAPAAEDRSKWSRQKLDERAKELGLDPESFGNKGDVLAAIEAKEAE